MQQCHERNDTQAKGRSSLIWLQQLAAGQSRAASWRRAAKRVQPRTTIQRVCLLIRCCHCRCRCRCYQPLPSCLCHPSSPWRAPARALWATVARRWLQPTTRRKKKQSAPAARATPSLIPSRAAEPFPSSFPHLYPAHHHLRGANRESLNVHAINADIVHQEAREQAAKRRARAMCVCACSSSSQPRQLQVRTDQ